MMLPKFSSKVIINKHTHTKDTDSGKPPFNKKYLCKWRIFQISKILGSYACMSVSSHTRLHSFSQHYWQQYIKKAYSCGASQAMDVKQIFSVTVHKS